MTVQVHPQTCERHLLDPQVYQDKLERAIRSLYHPMGVTVSVQLMPMAALPGEDYSEDWAVYRISLPGMGEAEARTIRRIAGRVFGALAQDLAPRIH